MEINGNSGVNAMGGNGVEETETDLDRDAFMSLLVTQIRNQDPMDPMDTRDMMAQLTQLTSVEHLIGIQDGIGALSVGTASIANAQVAGFVGHEIEADTSALSLEEAGAAQGAYSLSGAANNVMVTIRDAEGRTVRTVDVGPQGAGPQRFEWDGKDDSGTRLDPGRYTMSVTAVDADGAPVPSETRITGTVDGVSYDNGYPELLVGGLRVLLGDVRRVGEVSLSSGGASSPSRSASNPTAAIASYAASSEER